MMKLSGLPQFQAVCSTRNLTAAAQLLGVSQPALTQSISKLERQLGVPLFDRSTRPLNITAYGEMLLEYAQTLEKNTDDLATRIDSLKTGSGGTLRIGVGPDWTHELIPLAIGQMHEAHPNLRIKLVVALNDQLKLRLDAGEIDLFFASVIDPHFGPTYETRLLFQEPMLVVARRDHPVHKNQSTPLSDLVNQYWVLAGDETFGRQMLRRAFVKAGVNMPVPTVETNSIRAMTNILRHSQMIGFLSKTHMLAYPEISEVVTVEDMPLREGGIVWRRDTPLIPAAEQLIDLIEVAIANRESDD